MKSHLHNPLQALEASQEKIGDDAVIDRRTTGFWTDIKKRYGLTIERYHQILRRQRGVCPICEELPRVFRNGRAAFVVDHCHEAKVVRGLLCNQCNVMLGNARDNPETLRRGAAYLERFKDELELVA